MVPSPVTPLSSFRAPSPSPALSSSSYPFSSKPSPSLQSRIPTNRRLVGGTMVWIQRGTGTCYLQCSSLSHCPPRTSLLLPHPARTVHLLAWTDSPEVAVRASTCICVDGRCIRNASRCIVGTDSARFTVLRLHNNTKQEPS